MMFSQLSVLKSSSTWLPLGGFNTSLFLTYMSLFIAFVGVIRRVNSNSYLLVVFLILLLNASKKNTRFYEVLFRTI